MSTHVRPWFRRIPTGTAAILAVLLALTGGSATHVTALFAALALFRAPYMIALGVMPQLTSRLTARSLTVSGGTARIALSA